MHRRRRTDRLPPAQLLPADPLARARAACDLAAGVGFETIMALQVPHAGGQGVVCASHGRIEPILDIARGFARQCISDGRPLVQFDTRERVGLRRWRHAAIPIGVVRGASIVLVVSDSRLTRRESQALATWAAPEDTRGMLVHGGACCELLHGIAREFAADAVVLALFAQSGMHAELHVRSGGLLHAWRSPSDTVWGEVARHGAAFTLGDLPLHPGTELLSSVGMQSAALVGLENGHGIAIGALGVASSTELDIDVAHHLLERAPLLGPQVMKLLSTTPVPVPAEDGTVDLHVLAARVGCRRFAMYRREGSDLRLVSAHTHDGSRLASPPDEFEQRLVSCAANEGVGVVGDGAAAVLVGDDTVLYAHDPSRRALDCLRLALQDIRSNPFGSGGEDLSDAA